VRSNLYRLTAKVLFTLFFFIVSLVYFQLESLVTALYLFDNDEAKTRIELSC